MSEDGQRAIALIARESQRMADESTLSDFDPSGLGRSITPTSFEEIRIRKKKKGLTSREIRQGEERRGVELGRQG